MARWVARSTYGRILDREEATDIAAVALIERLYQGGQPTKLDLYRAARVAVSTANFREVSTHGLVADMKRDGREGMNPSFARYWRGAEALAGSFEEELVERIAIQQVWGALSSTHRQTFNALMAGGSLQAACELLGLSDSTYRMRLLRARLEARKLWHHPEEPSRHWARDHPGSVPRPYNKALAKLGKTRRARQRAA